MKSPAELSAKIVSSISIVKKGAGDAQAYSDELAKHWNTLNLCGGSSLDYSAAEAESLYAELDRCASHSGDVSDQILLALFGESPPGGQTK